MRMRVLHCIPTLDQGGAEKLLLDLVGQDEDSDHIVVKLCRGRHFFDDRMQADIFTVGMPRSLATIALLPWSAIQFVKFLRAHRPNVVVGWHYYGAIFASLGSLLRIPVIWSIHNTADIDQPSALRPWTRLACWLCSLLSHVSPTLIHYCSEQGRTTHEALCFARAKARVVYNGVDVFRFSIGTSGSHESSPTENDTVAHSSTFAPQEGSPPPVIGCLARFHPSKDHGTLLRAAAILKESGRKFKLLLAGQGCDLDNKKLARLVKKNGLADIVTCLGAVKDTAELYRRLDLVVLCSSSGESMPMTVLEALASGKSAVVTDVGAAKSVLGEFGFVAPPGRPVELAALIERAVWQDRDLKDRARLLAPSYVAEHYSLSVCTRRWQKLIAEAASPTIVPNGQSEAVKVSGRPR